MRLLRLFLIFALSLTPFVLGKAHAAENEPRPHSPRLVASVDFLNWTPHMGGLDFAVTEDGSALALGSGQVHSMDFDRDIGIRGLLGYRRQDNWSVNFGFTHFGSEGSSSVTRPSGAGQLFSSFSHPGGPEEAESAAAFASFDYDVFDVYASRAIICNRSIAVNLFGGLRWADVSHEISTRLDGRDFVGGQVNSQSDVNAFGIRFGGDCAWRLGRGWSVFGNTAMGAFYGQFDTHRFETDNNGAQTLVDLRHAYDQAIFNFETALGVGWECRRGVQLNVGYEMNVWTNLGSSLRFGDDIEEASISSLSGDLLLEGLFVRVSKAW